MDINEISYTYLDEAVHETMILGDDIGFLILLTSKQIMNLDAEGI